MPRVSWPVALLAGLAATACIITENPGFDASNSSSGTTSATSTTSTTTTVATTDTTQTPGPTTSGGSAAGSTGDFTTDALLTTTGEPTTTGTTTGTTGDATTTDALTTDTTAVDTTVTPQPMISELKHYNNLAECDFPFWCVYNGNINTPGSGEHWDAECFDADLPPPFLVDRVGFMVFGTKDGPEAALEFHAYDNDAQKPVKEPFDKRAIGVVDVDGYHDITLDPPIFVSTSRFCISVHSGKEDGPQLGLATDDKKAPFGQTFVGINGPQSCDFEVFTDLAKVNSSSQTQWCMDATIRKDP